MKEVDFQKLYREVYSGLGFELKDCDQVPEEEIHAAEERLGIKAPKSLRDYFLVAGKEKKLNTAFNRLLSPADWDIHEGKIIFMEENQRVVVWGTDAGVDNPDPQLFQSPTFKRKRTAWHDEGASCSAFLIFSLYLQSTYGGAMPHLGSAEVTREIQSRLDAHWNFVGEIGGMRTYGRPGQALCFVQFPDFFTKTSHWRIIAGATEPKSLDAIANTLEVKWDP